ncbi:MAG TPA: hypothetical protein VGB48_06405, partial [Allosphingosinicella sp.]
MIAVSEAVPAEWNREGARLDLLVGGVPQLASGEDIYALIFDNAEVISGKKILIGDRPAGLSFSRYPATLAVAIDRPQAGAGLICVVSAQAGAESAAISLEPTAPDHCIIGDRWFPLATG